MRKLTAYILFFAAILVLNACIALANDDDELLDAQERTNVKLKTVQQEYDDEEFVGYEQPKKAHKPEPIEILKTIEKSLPNIPAPRTNYYLEYGYAATLIVYVVFFWLGKSSNDSTAKALASSITEIVQENFTKVGLGITPRDPKALSAESLWKDTKFIKESHNVFKLKATGRVNCVGLQATLELKKRQEPFTCYIVEPLMNTSDTLNIDILLEDNGMDNFVLAILKKKEDKKYRKTVRDLSAFAVGNYSPDSLDDSLTVVTETEEVVNQIVRGAVAETINKFAKYLVRVHISDQEIASAQYKKSIQVVFKLPPTSEFDQFKSIVEMSLYLADIVSEISLSKLGKQKSEKNRQKATEQLLKESHEQRQEAAQQRKLEKLQKEKAAVENMTPEQQRKWEEKQAKKEQKKKQNKFKVVMKA